MTGGLTLIGNVSSLNLAVSEDTKELADFTSSGGGTYNKVIRIKSVDASMTLHDVSPSNLAIATRGVATAVTAGTVTDEPHVAYTGSLVKFDFIPDREQTIAIKDNTRY